MERIARFSTLPGGPPPEETRASQVIKLVLEHGLGFVKDAPLCSNCSSSVIVARSGEDLVLLSGHQAQDGTVLCYNCLHPPASLREVETKIVAGSETDLESVPEDEESDTTEEPDSLEGEIRTANQLLCQTCRRVGLYAKFNFLESPEIVHTMVPFVVTEEVSVCRSCARLPKRQLAYRVYEMLDFESPLWQEGEILRIEQQLRKPGCKKARLLSQKLDFLRSRAASDGTRG